MRQRLKHDYVFVYFCINFVESESQMTSERKLFWIGAILFLVGGTTVNQYPPFDPSAWVMLFGLGMMYGAIQFKE